MKYKLTSSAYVSLQDPKVRYPAMADDLELLHDNKRFVSCAILMLCFIDALAAGRGKATSGKFVMFVKENLSDFSSALASLRPKKQAGKILYDSYRNKLAHLFRLESDFLLCENHEIGGEYAAEVEIDGRTPCIGINIDRLVTDFVTWLREEVKNRE
jgi:hypothetical protein